VFENKVLRRIFGSKKDEIMRRWRKLHDEELNNLYSSPNRMIKSRRMIWPGHVARMGEKRIQRVLVGKPEGKRTIGRHRCGWGNNIKILKRRNSMGWGMDWIHLAQDKNQRRDVVKKVMNLRVPKNFGKFLSS
jgi:hypothetical protein